MFLFFSNFCTLVIARQTGKFSKDKTLILPVLDKFLKLAQVRILKWKSTEDVRRPLRDLFFFYYGVPKTVVIDSEISGSYDCSQLPNIKLLKNKEGKCIRHNNYRETDTSTAYFC